MWQLLGSTESLSYHPFPKADERYLHDETTLYVVQVNGKVRGRFELPKDQKEEIVLETAMQHQLIQRFLDGQKIVKVVFVPNKLLNIVVTSG